MSNILIEKRDSIAFVTVNRPEKLNAIDAPTIQELYDAIVSLKYDDSVRVIILTGAGDKAFVAGADIEGIAKFTPFEGRLDSRRGQQVFNFIEQMPKPVICAINGYALGGGCELTLACHIRLASENAKMGQLEVKLGVMPGYGATQRLPRLIGKSAALNLILTGKMIDAREAYRIGLIDYLVPFSGYVEKEKEGVMQKIPDYAGTKIKLLEEAEKLAREILSSAPIAVSSALEAVNRGMECNPEEGQKVESDLFGLVLTTEDFQEGINAFKEKRKAVWRGK